MAKVHSWAVTIRARIQPEAIRSCCTNGRQPGEATSSDKSGRDHLHIARHTNSRFRQRLATLFPVSDFIADDAAKFSIDLLLTLSVADTANVEIGAVADVKLILVRPADEAVILVGGFHGCQITLHCGRGQLWA